MFIKLAYVKCLIYLYILYWKSIRSPRASLKIFSFLFLILVSHITEREDMVLYVCLLS